MEEAGRQTVRHGGTVNLSCHADAKTKGRLKFSDGLKLLLDMKGFILKFRKTRIPYI